MTRTTWLCALILASCAALAAADDMKAPQRAAAAAPRVQARVCLLFFNDIHGHLEPFVEKNRRYGTVRRYGGIARLAALVRAIRAANARRGVRTFVLYGGDLLMGTPLSTVFKGEPGLKCLRAMGVDAFVLGNHEFDYGLPALEKLVALGGDALPLISSNIDRGDAPLVRRSVALDLGLGHALKVVGITAPDTPEKTAAENTRGLTFQPCAPAVAAELARLADRPGPAVVLSHAGWQADMQVAQRVPGLPLIVGAHDQILMFPTRHVDDTVLVQAYEKCKLLGQADLVYDYASQRLQVTATRMHQITPRLPVDPEVAAIVATYVARLSAAFGEQIATVKTALDGSRGVVRYEETNFGSLIADIMRQRTGTDVALLNAGAIRGSLGPGPITISDVMKAFPYSNELMAVTVDGATLRKALTRGFEASRADEDGGFLHLSGARVVIDGRRLAKATVGGAPLRDDARYRVAITSFMKSGGDGYTWFDPLPAERTRVLLRDVLIDELRRRGTIDAKKDGRIQRR